MLVVIYAWFVPCLSVYNKPCASLRLPENTPTNTRFSCMSSSKSGHMRGGYTTPFCLHTTSKGTRTVGRVMAWQSWSRLTQTNPCIAHRLRLAAAALGHLDESQCTQASPQFLHPAQPMGTTNMDDNPEGHWRSCRMDLNTQAALHVKCCRST